MPPAHSPTPRPGIETSVATEWRIWGLDAIAVLPPVIFLLYCFLPATEAWWSIIDDHRKMHVQAVENGMPISAALRHFWQAVDFQPLGQATRVQPIFHVLWGLELHTFGLDARPWYFMRIACAIMFVGFLVLGLRRHFGTIAAMATGFAIAMPAFYGQVFLRLGVAESYLSAALALAFYLGSGPEPTRRGSRIAAAAVYFGALVVGFGSKEVALIFVPAVLLLARLDFRASGLSSPRLWAGIGGLAFAAFILVVLYLGLRGQTTDIYGQDLSLSKRLVLVVRSQFMRSELIAALAAATLAPLAMHYLARWRPALTGLVRTVTGLALAAGLIGAAYFGSILFYNASIPVGSHYEFPTYLLSQGLLLVGTASVLLVMAALWTSRWARPAAFAVASLVVVAVTLKQHPSPLELRRTAETIRQQTSRFEGNFNRLLAEARSHPDRPIEFVSHGFNDFEPVHSLVRFLRGYGARNPVILNTHALANLHTQTSWEEYLRNLMTGITPSPAAFAEVTAQPPQPGTIKVFFSRPELTDGAIANFWPL